MSRRHTIIAASLASWGGAFAEAFAREFDAAAVTSEDLDSHSIDRWHQLTTEEWQPGRVGEFNTTFPVKDMTCSGPETRIRHDESLLWSTVKHRMFAHLNNPLQDEWLLQASMQIQRLEPDNCVLGVTSTSAYLLPLTMPKFRNMARMLNSDHNFLILNVSFFDTLRSGFPVFGILDGLSSPEYRDWFNSDEGLHFFPPKASQPGCASDFAERLLHGLAAFRDTAQTSFLPLAEATAWFGLDRRRSAPEPCAVAEACALIIWAIARASPNVEELSATLRDAALRDVIELVSEAEERIRSHVWGDGVAFGQFLATPWNVFWLLHQLQVQVLEMYEEDPNLHIIQEHHRTEL